MPPFVRAKPRLVWPEELTRRIKEGAIPIISDVPGFMAYYVVYAPDDTVTAISIFNDYAGAEEFKQTRAPVDRAETLHPCSLDGNEDAESQHIGGLQDFGKKSLTLWKCNNGILRTHSSQTKNLVLSCFPSWRPRKTGSLAT